MEERRRLSAVLAFACSLAATALVAGSFATDHWVSARLEQARNESASNASVATGTLNFGLFTGTKAFNLFGPQVRDLFVTCIWASQVCGLSSKENSSEREESIVQIHNATKGDLTAHGLFSYSLWVSIEVLSAAAMFWGGIGMIFASINVFVIPIETANGLQGLYVWNILAGVCSAASLAVFVGLYITNIKVNVLQEPDDKLWLTREPGLGWSAWLLVGSVVVFFAACLCVRIAACQVNCCQRSRSNFEKVDAKTKEMTMLF